MKTYEMKTHLVITKVFLMVLKARKLCQQDNHKMTKQSQYALLCPIKSEWKQQAKS